MTVEELVQAVLDGQDISGHIQEILTGLKGKAQSPFSGLRLRVRTAVAAQGGRRRVRRAKTYEPERKQ